MPEKTAPDRSDPNGPEPPTVKELIARKRASGYDPMTMPKPGPYTGIAGFASAAEVRAVAADAPTLSAFGTPQYGHRKLAIGVLVSDRTFRGLPPKTFPERYPAIGDVRSIIDAACEPHVHRAPWQPETEGEAFDLKRRCLRLIHYHGPSEGLCARLDALCELAGPNLDGFQLNIAWPAAEEMRAWIQDHPAMRLVLQISNRMYANLAQMPSRLVDAIAKEYLPWCTDLLFDLSGGDGRRLDLERSEEALAALHAAFGERLGIGLAGGLDRQSVHDLGPFFDRWPDLSIDAEGRIRDIVRHPTDPEKILSDTLGENARVYARRAFRVMTPRDI